MHSITSIVPRLPSTDLARTKEFYVSRLGFKKIGGDYPDYLMLGRNEIELHFFLFKELNPLENYGMCYLRVNEIDALYLEFSQHLPDLRKPEAKPWFQKEMHILDPDHNDLAFGESIK